LAGVHELLYQARGRIVQYHLVQHGPAVQRAK
jgi:hypothetical protein